MRARLTTLVLMLVTAAVVAQMPARLTAQQPAKQAPKQPKTYTSAKEVAAMMAKAKNERKQDQANFIQSLLQLAPYGANLEYRGAVGPAAVHEKEAELFYVIDGSGTLVTGGKLVGETRPSPDNLNGTAIDGGMTQDVTKCDFFIVPENTPHWFSKINGTLVLMSLHVPRPVPAGR
jgi:mannose-6-phosphate isomerase-like protein (cupin superfamily)